VNRFTRRLVPPRAAISIYAAIAHSAFLQRERYRCPFFLLLRRTPDSRFHDNRRSSVSHTVDKSGNKNERLEIERPVLFPVRGFTLGFFRRVSRTDDRPSPLSLSLSLFLSLSERNEDNANSYTVEKPMREIANDDARKNNAARRSAASFPSSRVS